MKMTEVAIDRPVFVTMVTLAAVTMGLLAVGRMGLDLFPEANFPIAIIVTPYPGAGPREVEQRVTRPLEEAVASINGVDEVTSYSRQNASTVVVVFDMGVDARRAMNDIRDRVSRVRGTLPEDVMDPIMSRLDPTALPIMTYAIASPRSSLALRKYIDDVIRPALQQLDGVASVDISGGAEREIRVELHQAALDREHLTVAMVAQKLGAETLDIPAGTLTVGARDEAVKADGAPKDVESLRDLALLSLPNGAQVRLGDVATVRDAEKKVETVTRLDGQPAIILDIQKQGGANTVEVVDRVRAKLAELEPPDDVQVTNVIDGSAYIRINIDNLWEHLILGGAFAVLVIFLFMLDWRSTVISALALPVSIITTFFVMWQFGFTMNMMSMMGLTLAIGILIDDSVVVRENIFRFMEMGHDPFTAAREGTSQIALAVLATTLTIVAVFVPVAFTGGLVGQMFTQFGITVAAAVMVSLVVSFTLDPMLSARITQQIPEDYHERRRHHPVLGWLVRFYDWMDGVYREILRWTLRHKFTTGALATAGFVGSMALVPLMGQEFVNRGDRGEFNIKIDLPAGTSLAETDAMTRRVEDVLRQDPALRMIASVIQPGGRSGYAQLKVRMTSKAERPDRPLAQILEELRHKLADIPGLAYSVREANIIEGGFEEAPITIFISGPDYEVLGDLATRMLRVVRETPGVRDAVTGYKPGAVEQRLSVDRARAAERGVSFAAVAMTLRTALEGQKVTQLTDGEDDVDVRVLVDRADRASLQSLLDLTVPGLQGRPVELRDVVTIEQAATPSTIERSDRERHIVINANTYGRPLGDVIKDLQARLDAVERPPAYSFRFKGEAERMKDTFDNLGLAMALAVLFIYFVLASQFESFVHPLTIMVALPLAIVGAVIALFLAGENFGMPALIGIILLMGLVTKNSILLIDYTIQLRNEGMGIHEALLEAGPTRLRPILMTSAAIILGMLPTAVSHGEGSEFRAPMSIAVIGGVITSTFLTLVVVPMIYTFLDKLTVRHWRERRAGQAGVSETSAASQQGA